MPKKKPDKATIQEATNKKPSASSAIFDVAKPGSTPASPNSRPIIVGHQAMLGQDPLLAKAQTETSDTSTVPPEPRLTKQKKISPINDEKTDNTKDTESQPSEDLQNENKQDSTNQSAAIDTLAGEVDSKAQAKQQSKLDNEQQEKIQALVDSKKYHIPITEGGRKAASERIVSWLLVFLLVVAAVVWLTIDAGYLDIGIDLPYDLIKN